MPISTPYARAHTHTHTYTYSNKYFRATPLEYPLVSLSGYLHFWSIAFLAVTAYLAFFQPEVRSHVHSFGAVTSSGSRNVPGFADTGSPFARAQDPTTAVDQDEMDLKKVYAIMRDICRLKREFRATAAVRRSSGDAAKQLT